MTEENKPKPEIHHYVTLNGKEPEQPQSFFASRRFIAIAVVATLIFGVGIYFILVG